MAAASFGLPLPEPLQLQQNKQKWNNYEIATGVAKKDKPTRVATLLTVIGEEAVDVYNTVTRSHGMKKATNSKLKRFWRSSSRFATLKRTLYMNAMFSSREIRTMASPSTTM